MSRTLLESLVVLGSGVAVAITANAVHPDGLDLTRDYFGARIAAEGAVTTAEPASLDASADDADAPRTGAPDAPAPHPADAADEDDHTGHDHAAVDEAAVAARLASMGLQLITHAEVVETFEDPAYAYGVYLFVDARNDARYRAGHIPGAWQLDYYYADRYVDAVREAALGAIKVVVYCGGGTCEDSELAAQYLLSQGIAQPNNLFVYAGGMQQWEAEGLPLERGERGSGDIVDGDD